MPNHPVAYHITWSTYGTRLPGSEKPHVDRWHNEYNKPLPKPDPKREQAARDRMQEDPVWLTLEQRKVVEAAIKEVACGYRWTIHAMASQSDHTHVVLTACREGEALRDALKACATRALNKAFGKRTVVVGERQCALSLGATLFQEFGQLRSGATRRLTGPEPAA